MKKVVVIAKNRIKVFVYAWFSIEHVRGQVQFPRDAPLDRAGVILTEVGKDREKTMTAAVRLFF
jgi:hypothetical protein